MIIWPRNGNMLGGTEVNITGPCFIEETFFLCKWGDGPESEISVGETTFIEDHHTDIRGRCVQPTIFYNGRINLSISLDDGVTWDWKGEFNLGMNFGLFSNHIYQKYILFGLNYRTINNVFVFSSGPISVSAVG